MPQAEHDKLREQNTNLRCAIVTHADLFDSRAERAERIAGEATRTTGERLYWSGRAEVYRIAAYTLRCQLKVF